jgi:hypothetical protein
MVLAEFPSGLGRNRERVLKFARDHAEGRSLGPQRWNDSVEVGSGFSVCPAP